jgi:hypothetical protein
MFAENIFFVIVLLSMFYTFISDHVCIDVTIYVFMNK